MPGIVALVSAISTDVVASLAVASYPALVDGRILLGRQYQFEQSAPPRIIFVPVSSDFPMKDVYSASNVQPTGGYTAEQLLQNANQAFLSDEISFEVRCWGSSLDQNPDSDFDFTQILYQQVLRSIYTLANGTFKVSRGNWTDSKFQSAQMVRDGREFVFNVTFGTPVPIRLTPLVQAPPAVAAGPTTNLELATGETNVGCTS